VLLNAIWNEWILADGKIGGGIEGETLADDDNADADADADADDNNPAAKHTGKSKNMAATGSDEQGDDDGGVYLITAVI
jgi:hypothetical protein